MAIDVVEAGTKGADRCFEIGADLEVLCGEGAGAEGEASAILAGRGRDCAATSSAITRVVEVFEEVAVFGEISTTTQASGNGPSRELKVCLGNDVDHLPKFAHSPRVASFDARIAKACEHDTSEYANDGYYHQQLDQGETSLFI